ncbi:hypothetical protein LAJ19_15135 (plasmid) [Deinococcus taeanensis]|uniref:hypothetical protein n=1 Tax=Deinococcus taeanensis TaxID=2737050 RepID=UPI001CDD3045|nr:hypothetical protein [Deinococcus taeanensis]UBV44140.1 hypothetical protein LAJ19_15135 [Deinococcus taeanensis]
MMTDDLRQQVLADMQPAPTRILTAWAAKWHAAGTLTTARAVGLAELALTILSEDLIALAAVLREP